MSPIAGVRPRLIERDGQVVWEYDDGGRVAAGFRGHAGDCATRAIAIATGRPYREVYDELFERARAAPLPRKPSGRKRKTASPRHGVSKVVSREYLLDHGWYWTPTMGFGTGCRVHLRREELPAPRLIASCSRHLVAVIDGVIRDTYDPSRDGSRCVYGIWTPRDRPPPIMVDGELRDYSVLP
jgi:hypothetical protein